LRNTASIKKALWDQITQATFGVAATVKKMQTDTGVKDKIAQHWIEILLKKSHQMAKDNPSSTASENSVFLLQWLNAQPGDKINPLLDMPGLCNPLLVITLSHMIKI
jgi:hypothetical protein